MPAISSNTRALLTCRAGACRAGASRFGFAPTDTLADGTGTYVWTRPSISTVSAASWTTVKE